jgi:hypothetical protein
LEVLFLFLFLFFGGGTGVWTQGSTTCAIPLVQRESFGIWRGKRGKLLRKNTWKQQRTELLTVNSFLLQAHLSVGKEHAF